MSLKKNTERVIAMEKVNDSNKLAIQMLIAMVSGILVGLLFMAAREYFGADSTVWIRRCNRKLRNNRLQSPSGHSEHYSKQHWRYHER